MSCEIQARLPFHIASTHLVAAYGIKQENEKALNQMHIKWLFAVVWDLKWNEANRVKNEERKKKVVNKMRRKRKSLLIPQRIVD